MVKLEHKLGTDWINPIQVLKVHGIIGIPSGAEECTVTMANGSTFKVKKPLKKVIELLKKK